MVGRLQEGRVPTLGSHQTVPEYGTQELALFVSSMLVEISNPSICNAEVGGSLSSRLTWTT